MDAPDRRFSEEEAHAIFARAAKQQEALRRADEQARAGLSLAELQAIGAEVGIDPALVAAAAADAATQPPATSGTVLGMPRVLREVRTLDAPLTDALWETLVGALRARYDQPGAPTQIGRVREWTVVDPLLSQAVTVRAQPTPEGRTQLDLNVPLWEEGAVGLLAGGVIPLALFVFTFFTGWPEGTKIAMWVMMGLLTLACGLGAVYGYPARGRVHVRRFDAAADAAELAVLRAGRDAASARPAERGHGLGHTSGGPRLDLPADGPDAESPARDRRRAREAGR